MGLFEILESESNGKDFTKYFHAKLLEGSSALFNG